jgi:hypothetical protein
VNTGRKRCLVAAALAAMAAACASTPPRGPDGEETLAVKAWERAEYPGARDGPDISGARCTLGNERGSWTAVTPAQVTVLTSITALQVECTAEGYKPMRATFRCRSLREVQKKRVASVLLLPFVVIVPMAAVPSIATGLSQQGVPAEQEPAQSFEASHPCTYGNIAAAMSRQ